MDQVFLLEYNLLCYSKWYHSQYLNPQRGCRKRDPISSYLISAQNCGVFYSEIKGRLKKFRLTEKNVR